MFWWSLLPRFSSFSEFLKFFSLSLITYVLMISLSFIIYHWFQNARYPPGKLWGLQEELHNDIQLLSGDSYQSNWLSRECEWFFFEKLIRLIKMKWNRKCAKALEKRQGSEKHVKDPEKRQGSSKAPRHQNRVKALESRQGTKITQRHQKSAKTQEKRQSTKIASRQ